MASPSTAVIIITCSLIIIACSAQQFYAGGRYGKRGGSTFWSGSRYGRSGVGRRQQPGGGSPVEVAARNDRFFIGSRYGKRADESISMPDTNMNEVGGIQEVMIPTEEEGNSQVTCLYTGVTNLYRCYN
ncbi:hypothetical protein L9F63_016849, partial [Diploptera punctata]